MPYALTYKRKASERDYTVGEVLALRMECGSIMKVKDCLGSHKWVIQWSGIKCRLCGKTECY